MWQYSLYKAGHSEPIRTWVGDDMVQNGQSVQIFNDSNLLVALQLEAGHFVARADAVRSEHQKPMDRRVPGAWN